MTDDELRVARAAWDRDRAARWARVAALSGAAYTAAYGEYMVARAHADAVAAEAQRRGIRGRRTQTAATTTGTPPRGFRFDVSLGSTAVVAVADGSVRFPDPERVGLRDELRAAVTELDIREGQVLRGTFAGSLPAGAKTDVENRVLLNVSLPKRCLHHGFAFEHDRDPPVGWTCGYRYRAVNPEDPFELWRPHDRLVGWQNVPMAHGLTAAAIWWALRVAREPSVAGPATAAPATLLRATVTSPRPLSLNQIKAVVDGVVAAAQWTRTVDPGGLDRLSVNLARAGISAERATVFELLRDGLGAGGGHCNAGLIAKDGRVDPDDHLVVAGLVHVRTQATSATTLTAALYGAKPVTASASALTNRSDISRQRTPCQ